MTPPLGGAAKKSQLSNVGIVLLVLGLVVPRPLNALAQQLGQGLLAAILFLGTDVFRLCFFVGVTLLIVGGLRSRRWKKEAEAAQKNAAP